MYIKALALLMLLHGAALALPRQRWGDLALIAPVEDSGHHLNQSATSNGPSVLHPRADDHGAVSDEEWKTAVAKGCMLLQQMAANDKDAGQLFKEPMDSAESQFKDLSDLEKWGYGVMSYDDYYDFDLSVPIKKALEGLGVDTKKKEADGHNLGFYWEHENEKTIDGTVYKPTGASFIMVLNPQDGVIMSLGSYGPAYMGNKKDPKVTILPKLKAYSDITFLQYNALPERSDIKYIFRTPIENTQTEALAKQAISNVGKELGPWPGVTFDMDTANGKALLGSPNGIGGAFLLIQHKAELGMKTIDKVTVFQDDGAKKPRPPSMVFHVTDVETPKKDAGTTEDEGTGMVMRHEISRNLWWETRREE